MKGIRTAMKGPSNRSHGQDYGQACSPEALLPKSVQGQLNP